MKVLIGAPLAIFLAAFSQPAHAAPDQIDQWHRIAAVAKEVCGIASDRGSGGSASISLGGHVGVAKMLRGLGKADIDAKLKAGEHWWHGPSQSDFPRVFQSTQACTKYEFDSMTSRLTLREHRTHRRIVNPNPSQEAAALSFPVTEAVSGPITENRGIITYGQQGGQNMIVNAPTPHSPEGLYIGDLRVGSVIGLEQPDENGTFRIAKLSLFDGQDPTAIFSLQGRHISCDVSGPHNSAKMSDPRGTALAISDVVCKLVP